MKKTRIGTVIATSALLATGLGLIAGTDAGAATAPNGAIAFSTWDDSSNYDIYVTDPSDPDAAPARLTTDGRYNGNPDWSPDGTRIAFDGWADFGGPRIQVMDADPATADATVITEPCVGIACYGDFQPAWSPDGTKIAFVSSRNWTYEIYVMDATGEVGPLADATRLTTDPVATTGKSIEDSQVTWSPDGRRIAFVSTGRGQHEDACDLWIMDARDADGDGFGDNLRRLTFDESFNCDAFEDITPQWSPNSNLIAFTSTRSGFFDIWVVDADDPTDLRNVTQTPNRYEDQPGWSPDGTQIVFRAPADGQFELFSLPVPPATTGRTSRFASTTAAAAPQRTQLTFDGMAKTQPDWGRVPTARPRTSVLTVDKVGRGRVTSTSTAGIRCGDDCVSTFRRRATVEVQATPRAGWRFERWGRACSGSTPTCSVPMDVARSVVARFVRTT
jgi:Tol biopolymer transport system component